MGQGLLDLLKSLLAAAAQDPSPASLALAVALVAVIPMSVVVPMTAACLAAAALLPTLPAFGVMLGGLLVNTALSYGLAKALGASRLGPWMEKRGGALGFLRSQASHSPFRAAFLSRFVPAPYILAPMVAAAAGLPLRHMLLGTLVAMTPWTLAYVLVARAGKQRSLGTAGLALGVLALAFILAAYFKKRAGSAPPGAEGR